MNLSQLSDEGKEDEMTQSSKKVLAISGSPRHGSTNAKLVRFIAEQAPPLFDVEIFELLESLPHFNPDDDHEDPVPSVAALRSAIEAADGVLISTPEYVFSLPSVLKNALEWTVSTTVFSHKPVALIVAAASGAKAFESLQLILGTIYADIDESTSLQIMGAKGKLDPDGTIIDPATRRAVEVLIPAFANRL